ncbi:MAG: protein kinase [Fimbriiglobus sp.]|nr:protein kinase [Fimbriiglobus sp.]
MILSHNPAASSDTPFARSSSPVLQLARQVIFDDEWAEVPADLKSELLAISDRDLALRALVQAQLLTRHQAAVLRAGHSADLFVGQYRLLEPLGRGGMGVVYRADHRFLRRQVAVKVMSFADQENPGLANRFSLEARAIARLQHPNIVVCLDAGREAWPSRPGAFRQYFAMDLVGGANLHEVVARHGPLSVSRAAALFRQLADALSEAHRFGLVHRDIKPSNVMVTPDWRVKLLDFGMALHPSGAKTQPGSLLGTVGYMAPEQANNASKVDGRADVFALGATLFLAVTGREPFPGGQNPLAELFRRSEEPPPRVRQFQPDLPPALDDLIARLMDPDPDCRPPSAAAVSSGLLPFVGWRDDRAAEATVRPRVLIVDDDDDVRTYIRSLLATDFDCVEAADGRAGLALAEGEKFELAVVDQEMPGMDGARLIASMLKVAPPPGPRVLYMSGRIPTEALGGLLLAGADDFIRKPFTGPELTARVRGLLSRAGGRGTGASALRPVPLSSIDAVGPLGCGVAELLQENGVLATGYADRLGKYLQALLTIVASAADYASFSDADPMTTLQQAAVLHDIGMAAVPPLILGKAGRLDTEERLAVRAHAAIGAEVIGRVAAQYPTSAGLRLAAAIALSHHERWDGAGYPDGLAGTAIPPAARLVAIASVYDALRCRRPHRPGFTHVRAVRRIVEESAGEFDPVLVQAFVAVAPRFEEAFDSRRADSGPTSPLRRPPA